MTWTTTDLSDQNEGLYLSQELSVLPGAWGHWGRRVAFAGPAVTLKVFEDNSWVRKTLSEPGEGRVLVVDGGGSLRYALVGGLLGQLAEQNGWAGIVVDGAVRDADELDAADVGIRALGVCPRRSVRRDVGERDLPVAIAGVTVRPGDWIYADRDGILVARRALHV